MQISSLHPTKQTVAFDSLHPQAISLSDGPDGIDLLCAICLDRKSLYSCPRCRIPYCSVSCYQRHGSKSSHSDEPYESSADDRCCTEQFYENRVSQVLTLEVKERSSLLRHRIRDELSNQTKDESNRTFDVRLDEAREVKSQTNCPPHQLDRDELLQFLSVLETFEDTGKRSDNTTDEVMLLNEQLKKNCSLKVQTLVHDVIHHFSSSTRSGGSRSMKDLEDVVEWILEPWKPWWRPEIQSFRNNGNSDSESMDDECHEESTRFDTDPSEKEKLETDLIQTIDERIMDVPRFETLYRRRIKPCVTNESNLGQLPKLQYNLVDILLSTLFTLRRYCGVNNVLHQDLALDAASMLVTASNVFMKDVRHATLESVLLDCSHLDHPAQKLLRLDHAFSNDHSTTTNDHSFLSWTILSQDVALVLQNFRLVMRALFEADDVLLSAISELRSSIKTSVGGDITALLTKQRNHLMQAHKKIQFYLSWCTAIRNSCNGAWPFARLSSDILRWMEAWKPIRSTDCDH